MLDLLQIFIVNFIWTLKVLNVWFTCIPGDDQDVQCMAVPVKWHNTSAEETLVKC